LLTYFIEGEPSREGEEVVIIIKVLAGDFNNGYDDLVNKRIMAANGKLIHNLQELIEAVETDTDEPLAIFKTVNNQTIAIDRKRAEAAHGDILSTYRIAEDRSPDLKTAASRKSANGKKMAGSNAVETDTLMKSKRH
jgi:hypothetical protein